MKSLRPKFNCIFFILASTFAIVFANNNHREELRYASRHLRVCLLRLDKTRRRKMKLKSFLRFIAMKKATTTTTIITSDSVTTNITIADTITTATTVIAIAYAIISDSLLEWLL